MADAKRCETFDAIKRCKICKICKKMFFEFRKRHVKLMPNRSRFASVSHQCQNFFLQNPRTLIRIRNEEFRIRNTDPSPTKTIGIPYLGSRSFLFSGYVAKFVKSSTVSVSDGITDRGSDKTFQKPKTNDYC